MPLSVSTQARGRRSFESSPARFSLTVKSDTRKTITIRSTLTIKFSETNGETMEYNSIPVERQKKLAVLIDAENAQASIIKNLLDEVAKYGVASVKRIYGSWTTPQLQGWKEVLLSN